MSAAATSFVRAAAARAGGPAALVRAAGTVSGAAEGKVGKASQQLAACTLRSLVSALGKTDGRAAVGTGDAVMRGLSNLLDASLLAVPPAPPPRACGSGPRRGGRPGPPAACAWVWCGRRRSG